MNKELARKIQKETENKEKLTEKRNALNEQIGESEARLKKLAALKAAEDKLQAQIDDLNSKVSEA